MAFFILVQSAACEHVLGHIHHWDALDHRLGNSTALEASLDSLLAKTPRFQDLPFFARNETASFLWLGAIAAAFRGFEALVRAGADQSLILVYDVHLITCHFSVDLRQYQIDWFLSMVAPSCHILFIHISYLFTQNR